MYIKVTYIVHDSCLLQSIVFYVSEREVEIGPSLLHISRAVRIIHSPRNNQSDLASVMGFGQGMLRSKIGESRRKKKISG